MIKLVFLALLLSAFRTDGQCIAITFDDVPIPKSHLIATSSSETNLNTLLEKVDNYKIAFFILGRYVLSDLGKSLLSEIDLAHQYIGNHSEAHRELSKITFDDFKKDFFEIDILISQYSMYRKWYRFPYLDFGADDPVKLNQVFSFLKAQGYKIAYSTINPPDFTMHAQFKEAVDQGKKINYEKLKESYLLVIEESIDEAEKIRKELNFNFCHVLDLHQNDLNTLFMTDIIKLIENKKMTIVSPEEAFNVSFETFEDYKKKQEPFFSAWKIFPEEKLNNLFQKAIIN